MQGVVAPAASPVCPTAVRLHKRSAVVSLLFALSLVVMPFSFYLYEPVIPAQDTMPCLEDNVTAMTLSMQTHVNASHGVFYHDAAKGVVMLQTEITGDLRQKCGHFGLITGVQGSIFFPTSVERRVKALICDNDTTAIHAQWSHNYLGFRDACSMLWSDHAASTPTLIYAFVPQHPNMMISVGELLCRVGLSGYIAAECWRRYYWPVYRLYGHLCTTGIPKTTSNPRGGGALLVVGEPTSLILANGWVVLAFMIDLLVHPSALGSATLRLIQGHDWVGTCLGALYLGRLVWFAYGVLWVRAKFLPRRPGLTPASCTTCALVTIALGLLMTKISSVWDVSILSFLAMFNMEDESATIHVFLATFASYVLYGAIPLMLGWWDATMVRCHPCVKINPARSSQLSKRLALGDVKQRWLAKFYGLNLDRSPGSMYDLFAFDPRSQRNAALNQTTSDCFVQTFNEKGELDPVATRLCLASRVSWHPNLAVTFQLNPCPNAPAVVVAELHVPTSGQATPSATVLGGKDALWIQ